MKLFEEEDGKNLLTKKQREKLPEKLQKRIIASKKKKKGVKENDIVSLISKFLIGEEDFDVRNKTPEEDFNTCATPGCNMKVWGKEKHCPKCKPNIVKK